MTTTKTNLEDVYPLSPLQQGMLFHTLYAPQGGVYLDQMVHHLRTAGELDTAAFKKAWERVVERHTVLRTAFSWEGRDEPLQVVLRRVHVPMREQDWRGLLPCEQEARFEEFLRADRGWGFNLAKPPLLRSALIRTGETEYRWVLTYHHILMDAWSVPLVLQEVWAFYEAFRRGEELALERVRPFRDYIAWLRRQDLGTAETFWRARLGGFESPTRFGLAIPPAREAEDEPASEDRKIRMSFEATAVLQGFARRHRLTLSAVVQGAWGLLLGRYGTCDDVVFGVTVSGRPEGVPGVESIVGLFINTLPARLRCSPGEPLAAWLATIQAQQVDLRQFEFSPLVEVQGWSDVPRGTPLFESILAFENLPGTAAGSERGGRSVEILQTRYDPKTHYPISVMVVPGPRLLLRVLFDYGRVDALAVLRMLGHFENLLQDIARSEAERPIGDLEMLAPAERHQILTEWNDTAWPFAATRRIEEWFEAQAVRTPEGVAVLCESERLTYGELEERANRLAWQLRSLGVGPGSAVALYLDRSAEMVTALLGILKAGGTYVPVETSLPESRVRWVLEALLVRVVLAQAPRLPRLLALAPEVPALRHVVLLDEVSGAGQATHAGAGAEVRVWTLQDLDCQPGGEAPGQRGGSDALAYVIFTSGSTGTPKGVAVRHAAVSNLIDWVIRRFGLGAKDRVLFITALSFDLSVYDVFGLLAAGGSIHVVTDADVRDPEKLVRLLCEQPITYWDSAPAALSQLVPFLPAAADEGARLRLVFLSGDWIPVSLPDRIRAVFPRAQVIGLGGATEATVWSNFFPIANVEPEWGSIPYGRPIQNARYLILDPFSFQPCPVGVEGDLCIGGDCLASGYAGEPVLTAGKFVPDLSSRRVGDRLYRTGDRARFLADGNIEFLGRLDHQVKIRGFRIELGEIQAALKTHPAMGEALVLARPDATGERRLVAYFVLRSGAAVSAEELRVHLAARLPEYMVPAAFMELETFPLTANGKIDRQALQDPDLSAAGAGWAGERAANPVEEFLLGIWSEVLGLASPSRDDNFFELGGHSLRATQVISRVRQALRIEIGLRDLFEEPTVKGLAHRLQTAMRGGVLPESLPIERVSRDQDLPLSFPQQRLWFIEQLEHGRSVYLVPMVLRLEGELDVAVLRQGVSEVVRRHEVLRTTYHMVAGEPFQRIATASPVPVDLVDLSGLDEMRVTEESRRLQRAEAQRAFDLSRGPLLRVALVRLAPASHLLLCTFHHIVSDAWSVAIFTRELAALYDAYSSGRPCSLPELSIQYADYAAWQRRTLSGDFLEAEIGHWKQRLAGAPPVLEIPTDRPRPEVLRFHGARQHFHLAAELSGAVRALGRKEGATPFMILLAGFKALLARYTGNPDVSVGTPVAGRNHIEIENLIGFFANTLVLRTLVASEISFRDLLARVREVVIDAHTHQEVPFEKLVEELEPRRSLSHSPLVQVVFTLQELPSTAAFSTLKVQPFIGGSETAKFDLTLALAEGPNGLSGTLEYDTDLFDPATITRMLAHWERLFSAAYAEPAQRLSTLPLLTEAEEQVLRAWGRAPRALDLCCHELFEIRVQRAPEATALVFDNEHWTYAELDARANRIAHSLIARGAGPETRVGVCLKRSPDLVAALLGVLKSGGAFVPLDPSLPGERLAFLTADAGIPILVTQEALAHRLPEAGARLLLIDADAPEIFAQPVENTGRRPDQEHLAYVIYTSGSSGIPKGVLVSHRAIVGHCLDVLEEYGLTPEDRVLQFASFSFDVALEQLLPPLAVGAIVVLRGEELWSGLELAEKISDAGLTVVNLPTALWHRAMTDWAGNRDGSPHPLRLFLVGGEPMSPSIAAQWRQTPYASAALVNAYGPTEATITATISRVPGSLTDRVSIGRPLGRRHAYVLDRGLELLPFGIPGELCLGGDGLARGYLDRPALTAEKFVPDPSGREPGARLYRTGDLARRRVDGEFEILGRIDRQVKVRGFRIELGEIEASLERHPEVREAVVVLREDRPLEKRLVGYVVLRPGSRRAPQDLLEELAARLPEPMIPSAIVLLQALPLTSNGKVDRAALPPPQGSMSMDVGEASAFRSPVEELLAGIWSEVLGVERVGPEDNFFDLGGHSLLATQAISWICDAFGVNLPLRRMFELPSLSALAGGIDAAMRAGDRLPAPPMERVSRDRPLPLSFAQERLWFLHQLEPDTPAYNFSAVVRLSGKLDVRALRETLREVHRRHEVLRTTFAMAGGRPIQVTSLGVRVQLPVVDLTGFSLGEREEEARRLVTRETRRPYDLSMGPLFRALLLRLEADMHAFMIALHHIVSDGWSMGILVREINALYGAFSSGKPPELPELPIQYADFAAWQRDWLQGEALESQLAFWRRHLEGAPAALDLPTDFRRPSRQSFRGGHETFEVAPKIAAGLRSLSRRSGGTLFMTLLAAFDVLLFRWTGQEDVVVGTGIANRHRREIQGLIGFFVNSLALRADLAGNPTFLELLAQVRERTLEAYAHQDLPFEKLVEDLQPKRLPSRPPLFQVMFALQNARVDTLDLPGLAVRPFRTGTDVVRFDLELHIFEQSSGELNGVLLYCADIFRPETARRMVQHFQTVLESVVEDPEGRLLDFPLENVESGPCLVESTEIAVRNEDELFSFQL